MGYPAQEIVKEENDLARDMHGLVNTDLTHFEPMLARMNLLERADCTTPLERR